ncbi:MAG: MmgE/PrpD family protein [Rhodobacteraceae bacterium]|nr:MmgE/PrpD family protein [Paracoccaceae bacterium]
MDQLQNDLTAGLAAFATGQILPSVAAKQVVLLSALDWLAVGVAGAEEPVSRILRGQANEEGGAPQAHLFGSGLAPTRMAALVNGTTSHALDYDDTHFAHIGHPSVAVFPAALALAERADTSVAEMLEAALVGMELSIRVGLWLGRSHYQTGFHQTATAGAFGATAAAGRLLGLSAQQMGLALGLAATRAAGLKAQFGTMGKPYNAGLAASCGVEVALLVSRGFDSNAASLEGEYGFGTLHAGSGDSVAALRGLGQEWLFENVSHKFHACCHGLHAALEAARELDLAAPEIAELRVRTHPRWMSVCNQTAPQTGLGAKFSYKTVLAMRALGYDTARLDSFSDKLCADPRLRSLRDLVQVEADDSLSETEAVLTLLRRDGARKEVHHDLLAPMELPQREARVREKVETLIGAPRAQAAWQLLRGGGPARDFGRLLSE